jgi:uncharacterized glyoxalase superfamily protein PhnB
LIANRSAPSSTVIPELPDDDVAQASNGAVIVTARGAKILQAPTDHPYGERRYTAEDIAGHVWTFSESIAAVDPASWGGTLR